MNPEGEPRPDDLAKNPVGSPDSESKPSSESGKSDHSDCEAGGRPLPHLKTGYVLCYTCGRPKKVG